MAESQGMQAGPIPGTPVAFDLPWMNPSPLTGKEPALWRTLLQREAIMAGKAEHAKAPAVVRVVELIGVSSESWDDAARQALARASETIRHITGLDVLKTSAVVKDGKIVEYHADVKVAFVVEKGEIEKS